jgi:hypothetical protein
MWPSPGTTDKDNATIELFFILSQFMILKRSYLKIFNFFVFIIINPKVNLP